MMDIKKATTQQLLNEVGDRGFTGIIKLYTQNECYELILGNVFTWEEVKGLEEYRLSNEISQEKLAKLLGVHFCTVNRWLKGRQKPSIIQGRRIKKLIKGEGGNK